MGVFQYWAVWRKGKSAFELFTMKRCRIFLDRRRPDWIKTWMSTTHIMNKYSKISGKKYCIILSWLIPFWYRIAHVLKNCSSARNMMKKRDKILSKFVTLKTKRAKCFWFYIFYSFHFIIDNFKIYDHMSNCLPYCLTPKSHVMSPLQYKHAD